MESKPKTGYQPSNGGLDTQNPPTGQSAIKPEGCIQSVRLDVAVKILTHFISSKTVPQSQEDVLVNRVVELTDKLLERLAK